MLKAQRQTRQTPAISAAAPPTAIQLQIPPEWPDYALLDSGEGAKLERFGQLTLIRPELQAIWRRRLPPNRWDLADASFEKGAGDSGAWIEHRPLPPRWPMHYEGLTFWARRTSFRHTGVFPEQAAQWRWLDERIKQAGRPFKLLDLFAYTAISTLVAARAGAQVTCVDASRPALGWARENQEVSGLQELPIRWILDDALKFVRREARRGVQYDGIVMDPPVFGRGPEGEVWRFYDAVPALLDACRTILSEHPRLVLINAYALEASSVMLGNLLGDMMRGHLGTVESGELGLQEQNGGRILPSGIFGRWSEGDRSAKIEDRT